MLTALLVPAGKDWSGRCISLFEHDPICHIACDMHDGWTVAAEFQGVWARPIEQLSAVPGVLRYDLPLTDILEDVARSWLRRQVGTRYSYESIAADLINVLIRRARVEDADDHRYVCSSLLAEACYEAHLDLFSSKPPLTVTPADWHALYLAKEGNLQPLKGAEIHP